MKPTLVAQDNRYLLVVYETDPESGARQVAEIIETPISKHYRMKLRTICKKRFASWKYASYSGVLETYLPNRESIAANIDHWFEKAV